MPSTSGSSARAGAAERAVAAASSTDVRYTAIAAYLTSVDDAAATARSAAPARAELPDVLGMQWRRLYELRYGENPHQKAAFYADASSPLASASNRPTVATGEVL